MTADAIVEVVRGTVVESRHRVHAAVVDAEGRLRGAVGSPDLVTFMRSAGKPFQAIPMVTDGALERFGVTSEEVAVACGSHSGGRDHLRAVGMLLQRIGSGAEALACGPQPPMDREMRRELAEAALEPGRLHNRCSGKHAAMLAVARVNGWDTQGYERADHPVQRRMVAELGRWLDLPPEAMALGTDGCSVVTVGVPLRSMALAYARLSSAARGGDADGARVASAMIANPAMIAGEGRLCTELITCTEGRLLAKVGAEGLYCVGVPGAELGIALKIEDGANRAVGPALIALLRDLDLISEDDVGVLLHHACPEVTDARGETVGQIRVHGLGDHTRPD